MADVTPGPLLGAAYGLRQSLDTVGAFAGPLAAMALMALTVMHFGSPFGRPRSPPDSRWR